MGPNNWLGSFRDYFKWVDNVSVTNYGEGSPAQPSNENLTSIRIVKDDTTPPSDSSSEEETNPTTNLSIEERLSLKELVEPNPSMVNLHNQSSNSNRDENLSSNSVSEKKTRTEIKKEERRKKTHPLSAANKKISTSLPNLLITNLQSHVDFYELTKQLLIERWKCKELLPESNKQLSRSAVTHYKRSVIKNFLWKARFPYPSVEGHKHLEGDLSYDQINNLSRNKNLFWDEDRSLCRRHKYPTKTSNGSKPRIPIDEVKAEVFLKACCIVLPGKSKRTAEVLKESSKKFNTVFAPRGSILDRVPLWEQLCMVMKQAEKKSLIYQELMFGIYDIPVPEKFQKLVENFAKKMTIDNFKICFDYLSDNPLKKILEEEEQKIFIRKVRNRFPDVSDDSYVNTLLELSYVKAFKNLFDKELLRTQENLKKVLNYDPFDVKSPYTLKLIFEVMRHYSLGKFIAWAIAASEYIAQENSKIVGMTIDGPQTFENSIRYFEDHISVLQFLKNKNKTKLTIHALEFDQNSFENIPRLTQELTQVLTIADRMGHGTMTQKSIGLAQNLQQMQKNICIEICPSTAEITTQQPLSKMPHGLDDCGIAVFINSDDGGIPCKEDGTPTDVVKEQMRVMDTFGLGFRDMERMTRHGLEFSFLSGESIYTLETIEEEKEAFGQSTNVHVKRIAYKIKDKHSKTLDTYKKFNVLIHKAVGTLDQIQLAIKNKTSENQVKEINKEFNELFLNIQSVLTNQKWQQFFPSSFVDALSEKINEENDIRNIPKKIDHLLDVHDQFSQVYLLELSLTDKEYKQLMFEMKLESYKEGIKNSVDAFKSSVLTTDPSKRYSG